MCDSTAPHLGHLENTGSPGYAGMLKHFTSQYWKLKFLTKLLKTLQSYPVSLGEATKLAGADTSIWMFWFHLEVSIIGNKYCQLFILKGQVQLVIEETNCRARTQVWMTSVCPPAVLHSELVLREDQQPGGSPLAGRAGPDLCHSAEQSCACHVLLLTTKNIIHTWSQGRDLIKLVILLLSMEHTLIVLVCFPPLHWNHISRKKGGTCQDLCSEANCIPTIVSLPRAQGSQETNDSLGTA